MNCKENMELIFQHKKPDWIPHLSHDTYGIRDYIVERPIMTTGYNVLGMSLDQLSGFIGNHSSGYTRY